MPRVMLTRRQKVDGKIKDLSEWARRELRNNDITISQLAEYLDVSDQSIYKQFKDNHITIQMIIAIRNLCNVDLNEVTKI